jgi:hypothetical protein
MTEASLKKSRSLSKLAGVFTGAVLCGIGLIAHAQTTGQPSPPPAPPTAIGGNGKPLVDPVQSKVLADPDTRMYSRCTTGDEHEAPVKGAPEYKRPPKAEVITEDEAKSRGYRPGAHKVSCK